MLLSSALALAAPVTVTSAGAEPREALRYRWSEGTVQELTLTSSGHNTVELGGLLPDPDPFTTHQEATWKAVASPGGLVLEVVRASVRSDGPEAPPDLSALAGLRGTLTVDDRGRVSEASWTAPPHLDERQQRRADGLQTSLSAVVPLPEEDIGVGGRWQVVDAQESAGMALRVVRSYELVERTADRLVLTLSIALDAPPARVSLPAFEGDVQSLTYTGSQRLELDLTRPLPTLAGRSKLHLDVRGKKALIPVSMVLDVDQEVSVR